MDWSSQAPNPWLAATPDGLVSDPQATPQQGLVEFKNPYSFQNMLLRDAIDGKKCTCLVNNGGDLSLKHSHQYFHQVQFAMFCTKTKWCDFFICAKDFHGERILYDDNFCSSIISKLKRFYFCAILPELVVSRLPIREPKEWRFMDEKNRRNHFLIVSILLRVSCLRILLFYCITYNQE